MLAYFTRTEHIEKYANCVGVFHTHGISREIREMCWRIWLAGNLWRNMRAQFAYFTLTEHVEKYANCIGVFRSYGTN